MNKIFPFLLPILLLLFSWNLCAQEVPPQKNVPILKGEVSPIDGVVVPELSFIQFLDLEIENEKLKEELEAEKKFCSGLEITCNNTMEKLAAPTKWYKTNRFHRIFGFTVGVVVTLAGGILVVKIID